MKEFLEMIGMTLLISWVLGMAIFLVITIYAGKNCESYGKLTSQETAMIGFNCYNKQGIRLL